MPLQLYDKSSSGTLSATDSFYNLVIKNNNTGYDAEGNPVIINNSTPLVFDENRSIPYLCNPKDHFVSIQTMQLDTASLPVFICEPIIGDTNVDNTLYFYTVTVNDVIIFHERIQWQPDDLSTPKPTGEVPTEYTRDPYYFCYSYQHFLTLFNTQIAKKWSDNSVAGNPPFLMYENGSITLYVDITCLTDIYGVSPSGIKIYLNTELYLLVSGLPALKKNETSTTPNMNYQLLFVQSPSSQNTITLYSDLEQTIEYAGLKFRCEYIPLAYWNPIDSIILTSNYVNVVPELVGANSSYGLTGGGSELSNAEQYYILFDYMSPSFVGSDYQPHITYEPNAEFRLSDLYGVGEVNQLQIRALWKDKWGILHIFTLESGGSASIKLLFRKKRFYE
jgi:hypothetical protein